MGRVYLGLKGVQTYPYNQYVWAGSNYLHILIEDYFHENSRMGESTTSYVSDTSETIILSQTFLFPFVKEKTYYVEGVIYGNIHVQGVTGDCEVKFTKYAITVKKQDSSGNETVIGTKTISIFPTETSNFDYYYPFTIETNQEYIITSDDRILLLVELYGYAVSTATDKPELILWHRNNATYSDLQLFLPIVL